MKSRISVDDILELRANPEITDEIDKVLRSSLDLRTSISKAVQKGIVGESFFSQVFGKTPFARNCTLAALILSNAPTLCEKRMNRRQVLLFGTGSLLSLAPTAAQKTSVDRYEADDEAKIAIWLQYGRTSATQDEFRQLLRKIEKLS